MNYEYCGCYRLRINGIEYWCHDLGNESELSNMVGISWSSGFLLLYGNICMGGLKMINIILNDNTADDVKYIQELQAMGVPDELIQEIYDMVYRPNGAKMDGDGNGQA